MGILTDAVIGGVFCGAISYFAKSSKNNQSYNTFVKIMAFLWAAPLFYVYVIYILLRSGTDLSVNSFVMHALAGTILSLIFLIGAKFIINAKVSRIINMVFIWTFFTLTFSIYFIFRLYLL